MRALGADTPASTTPLRLFVITGIRLYRGIEMVATRTGMGTATSLRRHFNRMFGVTPEAYRRTFRGERRRVAPRQAEPGPTRLPAGEPVRHSG